ncbi:hypothetical protein [Cellulomonas chitinilytica]|nr:hypothetical protein [Cellulomonas chitinilytica]
MGLICEYFVASSDVEAAAVVHRVGGPSDASGELVPEKRSLFRRRRPDPAPTVPAVAFRTVDGGGVEPVVQMGELEAVLTGRPHDHAVQGSDVIASVDDGGCLVVRLTPTLVAALADAAGSDLSDVATRWSQTEEFWGEGDPLVLTDLVARLAALARDARDEGAGLYCWVST